MAKLGAFRSVATLDNALILEVELVLAGYSFWQS